MSDHYYGDNYKPADFVEKPQQDEDANNPVVNTDPFADKDPVEAALIHETPMGGTVAAVPPLNEPVPDPIAFFETPDQEIPMGGTLAAVGPMDETIVHEASKDETINRETPDWHEFQTSGDKL